MGHPAQSILFLSDNVLENRAAIAAGMQTVNVVCATIWCPSVTSTASFLSLSLAPSISLSLPSPLQIREGNAPLSDLDVREIPNFTTFLEVIEKYSPQTAQKRPTSEAE